MCVVVVAVLHALNMERISIRRENMKIPHTECGIVKCDV